MLANPYVPFLPPHHQHAASLVPEPTWWRWHGHRVHIARASDPGAPARVLLVHGAGGHSGALWPITALMASRGIDVSAVDLPLYGRTTSPDPAAVRYDTWVDLLIDLVKAEHDHRPLVLLGASIGGLLAYEVAARSPHVAAVAATCLLDPRDWRARAHMTRAGALGVLGGPLSALARGGLARTMVPMSAVANLRRMSRNRALSHLCAVDPHGGAATSLSRTRESRISSTPSPTWLGASARGAGTETAAGDEVSLWWPSLPLSPRTGRHY